MKVNQQIDVIGAWGGGTDKSYCEVSMGKSQQNKPDSDWLV